MQHTKQTIHTILLLVALATSCLARMMTEDDEDGLDLLQSLLAKRGVDSSVTTCISIV